MHCDWEETINSVDPVDERGVGGPETTKQREVNYPFTEGETLGLENFSSEGRPAEPGDHFVTSQNDVS